TAQKPRSCGLSCATSSDSHQPTLGTQFESIPRTRDHMSPQQTYPYATHLNILYRPLEVVDASALITACTHSWYNQTLCQVNNSVVRLGVLQGEYHWHKHDKEDEFFFVIEGRFIIDLQERSVELLTRQGFVVPRGVVHRTRAPEKTVVLMVEN